MANPFADLIPVKEPAVTTAAPAAAAVNPFADLIPPPAAAAVGQAVAGVPWPAVDPRLAAIDQATEQYEAETSWGERLANALTRGYLGATGSLAMASAAGKTDELARAQQDLMTARLSQHEGGPGRFAPWEAQPEELKAEIARLEQEVPAGLAAAATRFRQAHETPTYPAAQALGNAESFDEGLDIVARDPLGAVGGVFAESLPAMVPGLAAGAVGGPGAAAGVFGLTSGTQELGSGVAEYLAQQGVDPSDPAAMQAALADPAVREAALQYAAKGAAIVGALDALAGGLAGVPMVPKVGGPITQRALNMAPQTVVQSTLGAGGEAGKQYAQQGEITNPGAVLAEALAEVVGVVPEAALLYRGARQAPPKPKENVDAGSLPPPSGSPAPPPGPAPGPVGPAAAGAAGPLPGVAPTAPAGGSGGGEAAAPAGVAPPAATVSPPPAVALPAAPVATPPAASAPPAPAPQPEPVPPAVSPDSPPAASPAPVPAPAAAQAPAPDPVPATQQAVAAAVPVPTYQQLAAAAGQDADGNADHAKVAAAIEAVVGRKVGFVKLDDDQKRAVLARLQGQAAPAPAEAPSPAPAPSAAAAPEPAPAAAAEAPAADPAPVEIDDEYALRGQRIRYIPAGLRGPNAETTGTITRTLKASNGRVVHEVEVVGQNGQPTTFRVSQDDVQILEGPRNVTWKQAAPAPPPAAQPEPAPEPAPAPASATGPRVFASTYQATRSDPPARPPAPPSRGVPRTDTQLRNQLDENAARRNRPRLDRDQTAAAEEARAANLAAFEQAEAALSDWFRDTSPAVAAELDKLQPPSTVRLGREYLVTDGQLWRSGYHAGVAGLERESVRWKAERSAQPSYDAGYAEGQRVRNAEPDNWYARIHNERGVTVVTRTARGRETRFTFPATEEGLESLRRAKQRFAKMDAITLYDRASVDDATQAPLLENPAAETGTGETLPDAGGEQPRGPQLEADGAADPGTGAAGPGAQPAEDDGFFDGTADTLDDDVKGRPRKGAATTPPPGPDFRTASQTTRQSIYAQAFRDAGFDPAEAETFTPQRQVEILSSLLRDTFGFKAVTWQQKNEGANRRLSAREAIDQLLDGYRNMLFMSALLQVPPQTMSLYGRLSLRLARHTEAYGYYSPGEREIMLSERANSFAHEWAHALDHYLSETGGLTHVLASGEARTAGVKFDPRSISTAFAELINAMFQDRAALAARVMQLTLTANDTARTAKQRADALAQLERLLAGAGKVTSANASQFVKSTAELGSKYFLYPWEMLARAFEAYVAYKAMLAGATGTEFITKGNAAYESTADQRLAKTYPKGEDRAAIFAAVDVLFDKLRAEGALYLTGDKPAGRPGDDDIFDLAYLERMLPAKKGTVLQRERDAFLADVREGRRLRESRPHDPAGGKTFTDWVNKLPSASLRRRLRSLQNWAGVWADSVRGALLMLGRRYKGSASVQEILRKSINDPGTGTYQGETLEEAAGRKTRALLNRLSVITNEFGLLGQDLAARMRLRHLIFDGTATGATQQERAAAAAMRRYANTVWYELRDAGVNVGFVEDTGYLSRMLDHAAIEADRPGFVTAAAEVYREVFDTAVDADASGSGVDPEKFFAEAAAVLRYLRGWQQRFTPTPGAGAVVPPSVDPTLVKVLKAARKLWSQIRELEASLETADDPDAVQAQIGELTERLREAIEDTTLYNDVRELYGITAARSWLYNIELSHPFNIERHQPSADFLEGRQLPKLADKALEGFYIADPIDNMVRYTEAAVRRAEFVRRWGEDGKDMKALFEKLRDEGVTSEDKKLLEDLVGTANGLIRGGHGAATRILNSVTSVYTLTLLERAAWASLSEPIVSALRMGAPKGLAAFGRWASFIVRRGRYEEIRRLSRAIGLISDAAGDVLINNRFGGTWNEDPRTGRMVARGLTRNFLGPIAWSQRVALTKTGLVYLQELAHDLRNGSKDVAAFARSELRELGVPEAHLDDFAQYLLSFADLPPLEDVVIDSRVAEGRRLAMVLNRLVDSFHQNPKALDRPMLAASPVGRAIYGLMSFLYGFHRNVTIATAKRFGRVVLKGKIDGEQLNVGSRMAYAGSVVSGLLFYYAVAASFGVLRDMVFNYDRATDELEKNPYSYFLSLGLTRSGLLGPFDVLYNIALGVKYERDLSNLFIGAAPSFIFQNLQSIMRAFVGRNSEQTNTGEWNATRAAYNVAAAPLFAVLAARLPGGPMLGWLYGGAASWLTSPQASTEAANALVGEKGTSKEPKRLPVQ